MCNFAIALSGRTSHITNKNTVTTDARAVHQDRRNSTAAATKKPAGRAVTAMVETRPAATTRRRDREAHRSAHKRRPQRATSGKRYSARPEKGNNANGQTPRERRHSTKAPGANGRTQTGVAPRRRTARPTRAKQGPQFSRLGPTPPSASSGVSSGRSMAPSGTTALVGQSTRSSMLAA